MGLDDEVFGESVCVVCKIEITDPKSLLFCCQCRSCFHQSGCSGVSDFRGFHMKRATWKCSTCDPNAFEQGRKRQRCESGETVVIDTDVFRELLETIKSLNTSVIELKNEVTGVKGELIEVRKINQNLVDRLSSIEKSNADKPIVSFADVTKSMGRRNTPSRQPNKQPKQPQQAIATPSPNVTLNQVNSAVAGALDNLENTENPDDGFRSVHHRRKGFRKPTVIGELSKDDSTAHHFEGTERRHWVYVGRVKSGTSSESIVNFVKSTWKIEDVLCNQLASRDGISSFKVGVRESHVPSLLDGSKWPKGVAVREFVFIPKRAGDFGSKDTGNFQKFDDQVMET